MSHLQLHEPPVPVTLVAGHTVSEPQTLEIRCRDHWFQDATVADASDQEIFRVKSKYGTSWSFRRSVYDAAGQHVFDLRHFRADLKNRWCIEDQAGKTLGTIEHVHNITRLHSNVNLTILEGHDGQGSIELQMRQKDRSGITTLVSVGSATIAEITMVERNNVMFNESRGVDRSVWRVRVAPSTDLALIVALALCRAEMAHVKGQ